MAGCEFYKITFIILLIYILWISLIRETVKHSDGWEMKIIIGGSLLGISLGIFVAHNLGETGIFWPNFWPNFISDSIVAFVIGIILVSRYEDNKKRLISEKRRKHMLALIKEEALHNQRVVKHNITALYEDHAYYVFDLKSESWELIKNTGELVWINDEISFVNSLTRVYHFIAALKIYENKVFNLADTENENYELMIDELHKKLVSFADNIVWFFAHKDVKAIASLELDVDE